MPRVKQFDEAETIRHLTNLFWKKGYGNCSVEDLVKASGLSRSSLYDTFGGKEQLFIRCLQHYGGQMKGLLEQVTAGRQSALARIEAALNMPFSNQEEAVCSGCMAVNTMGEMESAGNEVQAIILSTRKNMEGFYTACILEGQENGEIKTIGTPEALGNLLYTLMTGLLVLQKASPNRAAIDQNITMIIGMLKTD